jgi:hypothetical protein
MSLSHAYDPDLHEAGTPAAAGGCSYHLRHGDPSGACTGEPVVSYQADGGWESGCAVALQELVERGEIEPLGQGA